MKLERLLAIVVLLMNKKRVQAKELADMFEVSVRTIYRDVDAINQAGIPVVTYQGVNGGIEIMEGYRLDKYVLTNDELAAIAVALRSVATSYDHYRTDVLLEKIKGAVPPSESERFRAKTDHVFVDFSPWGGDPQLKQKMTTLREALQAEKCVSFSYYSVKGEVTEREVEPHTLVLKGQKWYLYAFCKLRGAFRFFKLARMKDCALTDVSFRRQAVALDDAPWDKAWFDPLQTVDVRLRFTAKVRPIVEEWFDVANIRYESDGTCTVQVTLPEDDWLYGFILSFGANVEVLAPEELRENIRTIAGEVYDVYSG
ncbi:helix-turn-helix transcriptional regulator [Numidum massiliense]|uniref:helix-turn-helix transcriptional regulator n=1 Tax=Numidum massiliense TaxID=1522315 RepID=UPI0006D58379|nr:YafY family protein [Numidum massiliense]